MMQPRTLQFLADEHRRELISEAGSHRSSHEVEQQSKTSATQRSATGIPVTGGRVVRRAVAPRVGSWLIDFGTRLGGATVRTS
jgi:hypothetical protein